jgi:hypothetical protein
MFLFKTHNLSETVFCLRLQVEPTQLGPIDRTGIGTCSIYWAQLSRFHLKTETEVIVQIYLKHTTFWRLDSVSVFRLNLLSWAQSIELVPISVLSIGFN